MASASASMVMSSADALEDLAKLKEKEAALKKKERDLASRAGELERRKALIADQEEKHGNLAAREAANEAKEKELQMVVKDCKRRERAAKEIEQRTEEGRMALEADEKRVAARESDANRRHRDADSRDSSLDERQRQLADTDIGLKKREDQLKAALEQLEKDRERLAADQKAVRDHAAEFQAKEAQLSAKTRDVNRKMEAADNQAASTRNKMAQIREKEIILDKQRDHLNASQLALDKADKEMNARKVELQQTEADCDERVAVCHAKEAAARRKTQEAADAVQDMEAMREALERRTSDVKGREDAVARLHTKCKASEANVAQREAALASEAKDLNTREKTLNKRSQRLDETATELEAMRGRLEEREEAVTRREDVATQREAATAALQAKCESDAAANTRRSDALDVKQRDLVTWMKEMQWREMMLGADEEAVKRQPVAPLVRLSKRAAGRNAGVFDATVSVADSGQHRSRRSGMGSPTQQPTMTASSSGVAAVSIPEGFGHRAFGHAVVEVQFRRLKDMYMSAQMKHAQTELTGSAERRQVLAARKKRLARAGIEGSQPTGDLAEEAEVHGEIAEVAKSVRELAVRFVRRLAKLRAFDGFESPTSAEKIAQLAEFTPAEQAVLTMAANLEYVLRDTQAFIDSLTRSPLDHKDTCKDVMDLMKQTSQWWVATRTAATETLRQLLNDRQRYLVQAIAVLEAGGGGGGAQSNHHHQGGASSLVASPVAAASPDGDATASGTDDSSSSSDSGGSARARNNDGKSSKPSGEATDGEEWPYGPQLMPPELADPQRQSNPYTAESSYDHVRESAILAPRGLATLKAASEARSASPPRPATSSGSKRQNHNAASSSRSGSGGHAGAMTVTSDDGRPYTAPTSSFTGTAYSSGASHPRNGGALGGPEAEPFRTAERTLAEESLMNMGRGFRGAGAVASRRDFSLSEFLASSPVATQPTPSSPYSVPPVRPGTASSSGFAGKKRGSIGSPVAGSPAHPRNRRAQSATPTRKSKS